MHKVTGVLGLPFMVVFAWSGAFLCLNAWLLPAFVAGSFGGDASVIERAEGWRAPTSPSGEAMAAPEVRLLLSRAEEALPHASLKNFVLYHPGDRNASADIRGGYDESLSYYTNARMKRTGEVEWVIGPENARPRAQFFGALHGIHFAKWASLTLRVVYALLSLLAALCILTGCLVWLARRGALRPTLGDAILARLLSGGCAGLCFAVAVLFLVNRALPDAIPERAAWEHISFFVAWSAAVVYAGLWPHAARAAWWLLRIAAVLLFAAPLVDALYTGRAPFDPRPFGYQFGVELGLLLLCLLLLATGRVVRRVEAYADRASIMDKDPAAALEDLAR